MQRYGDYYKAINSGEWSVSAALFLQFPAAPIIGKVMGTGAGRQPEIDSLSIVRSGSGCHSPGDALL